MARINITFCAVLCAIMMASSGPATAGTLSGGNIRVPLVTTVSGGGAASGGVFAVKGSNMGGITASGARLSGGNFSLVGGVAPAIIPATAKPDLSAVHCYPVPFKPSAGHTKITFTGLTRAVKIRVYSISGELVRTLDKSDPNDFMDWDVKNDRGEAVVSGVYLYSVKSASQTKTGKLMIIR